MIQVLKNKQSENYQRLKNTIFAHGFSWYYLPKTTNKEEEGGHVNVPMYYHACLDRPDQGVPGSPRYPNPASNLLGLASSVAAEILEDNDIHFNSFLRIAINCVHPQACIQKSAPHVDHEFQHTNFLAYLSNSDGDTIVEGERASYEQDKVILFSGSHYMETPTKERRIVLVATFM